VARDDFLAEQRNDRIVLVPAIHRPALEVAAFVPHPGALQFLVDHQPLEIMGGISGGISGLHPAHRLMRWAMRLFEFGRLHRIVPQEFTRIAAPPKVEIIAKGFHAHHAADHVQPGSGGKGIAHVDIGPGLLHETGVLLPGLETDPHDRHLGVVQAVAADQHIAQVGHQGCPLQHHPRPRQPDRRIERAEHQVGRQFLQRRMTAALHRVELVRTDVDPAHAAFPVPIECDHLVDKLINL
jgi:hypothetical protein